MIAAVSKRKDFVSVLSNFQVNFPVKVDDRFLDFLVDIDLNSSKFIAFCSVMAKKVFLQTSLNFSRYCYQEIEEIFPVRTVLTVSNIT